jgi:hypothetical protein
MRARVYREPKTFRENGLLAVLGQATIRYPDGQTATYNCQIVRIPAKTRVIHFRYGSRVALITDDNGPDELGDTKNLRVTIGIGKRP